MAFEQVHQAREHVAERRPRCNHLEDTMLSGAEGFLFLAFREVACDGEKLEDRTVAAEDWGHGHVPPFRPPRRGSAESLKRPAAARSRGFQRGTRRFAILGLPEIQPRAAEHFDGALQLHVLHTRAVDVIDLPVEVEDLQAVHAAVDDAPVDVVVLQHDVRREAAGQRVSIGHDLVPGGAIVSDRGTTLPSRPHPSAPRR